MAVLARATSGLHDQSLGKKLGSPIQNPKYTKALHSVVSHILATYQCSKNVTGCTQL